MDIEKWVQEVKNSKHLYQHRLDNMSQSEVASMRNELAERGIEMTPDEINGCLDLLKEIISDEQ